MSARRRILTNLVASLTLAVLAVLAVGCSSPEQKFARHLERGEKYLQEENFEKARIEFRNALQIDPENAQARYLSGRVSERLGNLQDAVGLYRAAIEADPDFVPGVASLGRFYVFGGGPNQAIDTVAPALEKHPDDPDLLTVRGAAKAQLGDRLGALEDGERAIRAAPGNENAAALVASLYRQDGRVEEAITLVRRTLEHAPKSVELRQVLVSLYMHANREGDAESTLRQLVALRPNELSHRYQLALFLVRADRIDDADQVLRDTIEQVPERADAKLAYVDFLGEYRTREVAESTLRGYIARSPKDYDLQLGLGALQQRLGATEDAVQTYLGVAKADGKGAKGAEAKTRVATIRLAEGRYEEARGLVDQVLADYPRDNDALLVRGNLAIESKDPAAAIADLRAVLRDQPNAVGVLRTLARAHIANGEPALAEESLRAALNAAPADAGVRLELAQFLTQTERADQGIALLEDAVRAMPQDAAAREALLRAYVAKPDLEAAQRVAEDLKLLRPRDASSAYLAGLVAEAQGRRDAAAAEFEGALKLQPDAIEALSALSRVDVARGRSKQARERVAARVVDDPDNPQLRNLHGELLLADRASREAAMSEFERASALAPAWWLPYRNLALGHLAMRDSAAAVAALKRGSEATNFEPALTVDLAVLLEREGRPDEAIAAYETLIAHHPRLELASNNLAMLLVTYRTDQASLDRARDLTAGFEHARSSALLDTLAWVRYKRGEAAEALPLLERALASAPQSRVIRYHLALAQLEVGQQEQARQNLEAALEGSPAFTGASEARILLASLKDGNRG